MRVNQRGDRYTVTIDGVELPVLDNPHLRDGIRGEILDPPRAFLVPLENGWVAAVTCFPPRGCPTDTDGDGNCPRHPSSCPAPETEFLVQSYRADQVPYLATLEDSRPTVLPRRQWIILRLHTSAPTAEQLAAGDFTPNQPESQRPRGEWDLLETLRDLSRADSPAPT